MKYCLKTENGYLKKQTKHPSYIQLHTKTKKTKNPLNLQLHTNQIQENKN